MRLPERVNQLVLDTPPEELRENAVRWLSDHKEVDDFAHAPQGLALLAAAFLNELRRTAPADAPRVYKRVITDHLVTKGEIA